MKAKLRNVYLISPYIFSLAITFLVLVLLADAIVFTCCLPKMQGMKISEAIISSEALVLYFVSTITALIVVLLIKNSYEYFGFVEIHKDRVEFRTLFRESRVFYYRDIKEIGIDYGTLSLGHKQFWVYFGKEKIPNKFFHNVLRMPFTPNLMRIQYRQELYRALIDNMPYDNVGKKLCRSHSVITLFRVEDDE